MLKFLKLYSDPHNLVLVLNTSSILEVCPRVLFTCPPVQCISSLSGHYRALASDVTGRKTTETPSVILRFFHKTVWQEVVISTVILETQAARNLRSTTV